MIDHIPKGCGAIIDECIGQILPGTTRILSSNVRGADGLSKPKDVIKIHGKFEWDYRLSNLVALFTDASSEKSCRVSKFREGKRVEKWAFREYAGKGKCINWGKEGEKGKCVTDPRYGENIQFDLIDRGDYKECPYCNTIQ